MKRRRAQQKLLRRDCRGCRGHHAPRRALRPWRAVAKSASTGKLRSPESWTLSSSDWAVEPTPPPPPAGMYRGIPFFAPIEVQWNNISGKDRFLALQQYGRAKRPEPVPAHRRGLELENIPDLPWEELVPELDPIKEIRAEEASFRARRILERSVWQFDREHRYKTYDAVESFDKTMACWQMQKLSDRIIAEECPEYADAMDRS